MNEDGVGVGVEPGASALGFVDIQRHNVILVKIAPIIVALFG